MAEPIKQEHERGFTVTEHAEEKKSRPRHVTIVSHSRLFYWWPIWVVGFIMAAITWVQGETIALGSNPPEKIHVNTSLGLIYCVVFFFVVLATNITLRGIWAVSVILGILFLSVLFAWLGWWDEIIALIPELTIHMSLGFYLLTSVLIFILWCLTFFIFDRFNYWRIESGQIVEEKLVGGGEHAYDTIGLQFEQKQADPLRHWLIGLGAGDLRMHLPGAQGRTVDLPNVLFVEYKVTKAQNLIQRKPS